MSFEQSCIKQIKYTKLITLPTKDISVCYFGQLDCLGSTVDIESHFHVIVSLHPGAKLQQNNFVNINHISQPVACLVFLTAHFNIIEHFLS